MPRGKVVGIRRQQEDNGRDAGTGEAHRMRNGSAENEVDAMTT